MKVLLIDDEPELVSALCERLTLRGHACFYATGGEEGLSMLKADKFDAAVVDFKMPGLGGRQLIARIRRDNPAMRLIVMTGHQAGAAIKPGGETGPDLVLPKPFDLDTLLQALTAGGRMEGRP